MGRPSELWMTWLKTARRCRGQAVVIDAPTGREWTAEALTGHALALAEQLDGFRTGQRVAFQLANGAEWMAFFLATQAKGLAAAPLDGGLPIEGGLDLARNLKARAFYVQGKLHELDRCAPVTRAACIKITSGSSAVPKSFGCRAAHLLADGRNIIATMKLRKADRCLAAIPLGHSYGLGNLVMPLVLQGTPIVAAGEYLPRQLVEWSAKYRATVFPGVPALFRVLSTLPAGPKLANMRLVISAGAMLPPETAQAFHARFGLKIHNFYGSSETGGITYDRIGDAALTGRSVGKPLEGVKIAVRGGRVVVTSKATAMPGGKWRVPDYGEWNKRGELVLLGRAGLAANIGGRKVHPLEIETTLRAIAGVSDAHVWVEHRGGRDLLAAAVETKLTAEKIEHALVAKLASWKMPKHLGVMREFPRNERGKIDRTRIHQLSPA